jgi:predicted transposase YbfD/YdcC
MTLQGDFEVVTRLKEIPDPRVVGRTSYKLYEVLFIALCGAVADCDSWVEIEEFAKQRIDWFRKFIPLEDGVPSHDTLGRVFRILGTDKFVEFMISWSSYLREATKGQVVAIDGKTLRHSFDNATGKKSLHVVSAWAADNGIVLGQVATDEKSNEITAIPQLLELIDIKGCVVTIDAMGTQKEIAAKIIEGGGDYVLALKGNHPNLNEAVNEIFMELEEGTRDSTRMRKIRRVEDGHGRHELREYAIIELPIDLVGKDDWKGLKSLGMVYREREVNGKTSGEVQYYLTSLEPKVNAFARTVRKHWGVENKLHWTLDVTFSEDDSRIRKDNAPENTAILRRMAVSILKQDTKDKRSLRLRRKLAGWNTDYLEQIILGFKEN